MESNHSQRTPIGVTKMIIPVVLENDLPLRDSSDPESDRPLIGAHSAPVTSVAKGRPVPSTEPSAINDGGDEKQLGAQDRDGEEFADSEGDKLLSHAGDQFQFESAPSDDLQINTKSLERELREGLLISVWSPHSSSEAHTIPKKKFLPLDKLDKIVTKSSVRAEIQSWDLGSEEDLARMIHDIWGKHSVYDRASRIEDGKLSETSRRKLFAILILTGKARTILGLIEAGISDHHLPFIVDSDTQTMKIQRNADNKPQDIAAFADWESRDHDLFNIYQWHMLAPYFVLSSKENPKVHTYKLQGMRPLPFISDKSLACNHDPVNGGFGEVRRVRIHEAHLAPGSQMSTYFAMKTLLDGSPPAFKQEVEALKRIMENEQNRYVTRLLVAVEHGTNRSLMFPWAEGNLLQFWRNNGNGLHQRPADLALIRWMAKQFSGLASVIKLVHGPTKMVSQGTNLSCTSPRTQYGRHGDLKPENILFFVGDEHDDDTDKSVPGGPRGILKVADFGLAAFHTENSQRQRASRTARSKTHRAPEFDGAEVTASADLWSFGCILLEFLVWYQCGMEGVDKFSRARSKEESVESSEYTEDKFFMREAGAHTNFKVKETVVKEIADLRRGSKCSNFCNGVLDLIQCCLLRVNPDERLACGEVHKTLEAIRKTALESDEYCIASARIDATALEKSTDCAKGLTEALNSGSRRLRSSGDATRRPSSEEFSSQVVTAYEPSGEMSPQKAAQPQPDAHPDAQPEAQPEAQPAASFGLQHLWEAFFGLLTWAWPFNVVEWRR